MRPKEVVITSGGSRGIVSLGAAWKLQQEGIFDETHTYAGTSAGAVVAAGLAMGIECPKMLQRALAKPFQPDIRPGRFGLDSGKGLSAFIRRILGLRRPMTLKQLYQHTGKTLRICVCNVTDRCAEYWSHETHPNVDLLKALRISCSVPIMFAAVKMRGKLYVDGAVINCLPVRGNPADTLAITFAHEPKDVDNLEDFIGALCSMRLGDPPPRYDVRVDARGIDALDFRLDRRKSREAFQKGQQQASEWIKKNV